MSGFMKRDLLSACRNEIILCDGAMGTQLMARGLSPGDCGMSWNAEHPSAVDAVHSSYAAAGCRLITTNSFGGTRTMLARHQAEGHVAQWNRLAAELALKAAGENNWVFGDVGPFGDFLEPFGEMSKEELTVIFCEQIEALIAGGADAILVETMSDPAEVAVAVSAAKSITKLPVVASYAFEKSGGSFRTMMGATATEAVVRSLEAGADIVGANCGTNLSLDEYIALADVLVEAAKGAPVILQPNAGKPKSGPDGIYYDATGDEMGSAAVRLRNAGVRIIGGCCGTTPALLADMNKALL